MSALDYTTIQALVPPPDGWELLHAELLSDSVEGPNKADRAMRRAFGMDEDWSLDGEIIFRAKVKSPQGDNLYLSMILDSRARVGRKTFWHDLWTKVVAEQAG